MNNLTLNDWAAYAEISSTGLWKLEMENGIAVRMYMDAVMQSLMGAPDDLSPEEYCDFFTEHIYPDDMQLVEKYGIELLAGGSEVEYRYIHPDTGLMWVRYTGKRVAIRGNIVTLMGHHQKLTADYHFEKVLERENQLLEKNRSLEAQQQRTADYYKNLLDMERCGILAYTIAEYKIQHMNVEALNAFGVSNMEDAQKLISEILHKVIYPDVTVVDRLKALRIKDGAEAVDYEFRITDRNRQQRDYLARSEAFITPRGERSVVTTFLDITENKALKREKGILDALSIDYTCVYYCDFDHDSITVLKQDTDSNATVVDRKITVDTHSYAFCVKYYYDHFIIKESAPDFLQKMSAEYLKEYLTENRRFAYRFRTRPNPAGREFFEVQVSRTVREDSFCVVMGYRYIDDIVAEQEQQKLKLERALTEANRNREQLEQQITMVQNIHTALTSGAWNLLYNDAGELVEVNWSDTLRHMLGFTSTEDFPNTFETWSDRLHPEDKKRTLDEYEQVMADRTGKKNFDVEYRILSKEGEYHWFRATGYLSRRKDGSPQSFDGVFVNKDEKHATDEKLHQALKKAQEARNELLLEHEIISAVSRLYFSVYRIDLQTDFYEEISSDRSVHRLTGHEGKAQEKLYELCDSIVAEEYRKVVRRFFQLSTVADCLAKTDTVEIEYLASDGNWHQARFIEKKRDENGRVTRILYLPRIVSQEKQRELEQQRLQIAYQVAENANEAKTTFLLNMSHDIRTPMNAILGFSGLMRERLTDPELLHYQEMIDESGKLLLSIINNVLDMARIESGKVELDENCTATGDIISGVCKVFAAEAKKKNIQLVHKKQIEHRYILCDVTKIQEIFTNLISNAVKYTPDGGRITVTTTELPGDEPGYIQVKSVVEDTGIGMSKEFLPHIFELFSRERNTTSGKILGTGLGMQIVKRLVDLMQGTIEVSSELGKGSRFIVTIPHKIADEKYYEKSELQEVEESQRDFSGKRILLAEDNELNAEIAIAILSEAGLVVERAEDGIICVNKLEQNLAGTYDLILMDIQMPNMDGYQATQIIRQLPEKEKSSIPILAMTANAFEEDRKNALKAGMNGHIAKPIDVTILMKALAEIL